MKGRWIASPFAISEASGIGIPKAAAAVPVGWRVEKVNAMGAKKWGKRWSAIDIYDWFGFLSILFAKTRSPQQDLKELFSGTIDYKPLFESGNFDYVMRFDRFKRIRSCAHNAFMTEGLTGSRDAWMPFGDFVTEFNKHMSETCYITDQRYYILDESMSPFKPRADKYGGLPHLSYIMRKPMPFGTEFKSATTSDGYMMLLETQKGKAAMEALRQR